MVTAMQTDTTLLNLLINPILYWASSRPRSQVNNPFVPSRSHTRRGGTRNL